MTTCKGQEVLTLARKRRESDLQMYVQVLISCRIHTHLLLSPRISARRTRTRTAEKLAKLLDSRNIGVKDYGDKPGWRPWQVRPSPRELQTSATESKRAWLTVVSVYGVKNSLTSDAERVSASRTPQRVTAVQCPGSAGARQPRDLIKNLDGSRQNM